MRRLRFILALLVASSVLVACALGRDDSTDDTDSSTPVNPEATEHSSGIKLPDVNLPDIQVPEGAVGTAQAALAQAGEAAGTAVQQAGTAVKQAGDAAGTAAVAATVQGGAALATVQAIDTPDIAQLTERLAAARPDENGNLTVTLNESELNRILQLRYLVMSYEPELRDASVRFESGVIVLSGNVPLLLPFEVTLSLRPTVTDGQIALEILDASLGRVQTPQLVLAFASELVSSALGDIIRRLPEDFQLQSITVDEGILTIRGRINSNQ